MKITIEMLEEYIELREQLQKEALDKGKDFKTLK